MPEQVVFDESNYRRDLSKNIESVIDRVGERLVNIMKKNLSEIKDFPKAWVQEAISEIKNRLTESTSERLTQSIGLLDIQGDWFAMIRANSLEHGVGDKSNDGGVKIRHKKGVPGLNDDIDGYKFSYRESYDLPDSFNHFPHNWFKDAVMLASEIFEDEMKTTWGDMDIGKYIKLK